jgi:hypothetical protein
LTENFRTTNEEFVVFHPIDACYNEGLIKEAGFGFDPFITAATRRPIDSTKNNFERRQTRLTKGIEIINSFYARFSFFLAEVYPGRIGICPTTNPAKADIDFAIGVTWDFYVENYEKEIGPSRHLIQSKKAYRRNLNDTGMFYVGSINDPL